MRLSLLILASLTGLALLYLDDHLRGVQVALTTNAAPEWGWR